jgi:Asp-tRNA(Asn)/Glu-tRNA(Gln) amidotransferase A subunit family amidase
VEEDVATLVKDAALKLKAAGADVTEVSLPIHNDGMASTRNSLSTP